VQWPLKLFSQENFCLPLPPQIQTVDKHEDVIVF
jgi:hypothetical protein